MQIQNALITGSFSYNGADLSNITSSNAYSASLSTRTTDLESTSSVLVGASSSFSSILTSVSSSQQQISASLLALTASYNALSSSYTALSASYNTASSSFSTRITSDSSSMSSRTTQVEKTYASTGSNTFTGLQNFSNTCTPNSFTAGASIYTAGGLQVTQDSYFSSSVFIKGNVTVFGTQSVSYISSSQLDIGTNIITVNTSTPSVRYGGLSVFDSGSTGLTGSIFWDSELNRWIYVNASGSGGGATYGGGMFISGPRNSVGLGCEQGTTACMLLVGQGGDHLTSSMMYHSSTVTCIPGASITSAGAACFASSVTVNASSTINGAYPQLILNNPTVGAGLELHFKDNGTLKSKIGSLDDINSLQFYNGGAIRLTINNSGNVGIGTSSPSYLLDVNGTGRFSSYLYVSVGGLTTTFTGNDITFSRAGATYITATGAGSSLYIGTNNVTDRLVIASTGAATFSSSVSATSGIFTNGSAAYALNATSNWTASASNNPIITFGRAGSAVAGAIGYDDLLGSLYIGTTTAHNFLIKTDNTARLTIASTGAATFCSCVTATQFNVSTSGGATQIYNTGGGHTVITNATANKDINYQTSGTGGHYLNTAGVDRLIISSTGAATFSGDLTIGGTANTQSSLSLTRLKGYSNYYDASNRYGDYGKLIFNADSSWTSAARRWLITNAVNNTTFAIIRSADSTTDPSLGNAGAVDSGTVDFQISNAGAATFSSSVTAASLLSSTWVGAQGVRISSAPSVQGVYLGNSGTTCGDFATIEMVGGVCGGSEIDFTSPSLDYTGRIGYNNPSQYMWFVTNSNERMRITSCGSIIIGNTENYSDTRLSVVSAGTTSGTYAFIAKNSTPNDLFIVRSDGLVAYPKINDFTTGNSPNTWINPSSSYGIYINTSSIRYKRDVINYDKGIDTINQLRPVYYKGKSDIDGDKQFAGFIAEEIHDLGLEEFVQYNEEGCPNSLAYPNMITLAVKAIQEQQCTICSQATMINVLKTCLGIA